MISSLSGRIASIEDGGAVVEVGGVGYLVHLAAPVLARAGAGESVRLLTEMVVREDSMSLYGFETGDQREMFRALTGVNGLGPKLALAVLSMFEPDALRKAIVAGDAEALTLVPGIGKRGAQRILIELKEKIAIRFDSPQAPSRVGEVREALLGLGYTPAELREVLEKVASEEAPLEEQMRAALRELARS